MKYFNLCLFGMFFLFSGYVQSVEINHVYHKPHLFDPEKNQKVQVHFSLSEMANVQLNIYDDRDILIRKIMGNVLKNGDQHIEWDGKDTDGINVPAEAYRYTLNAEDTNGKIIEYDVSDHTGGKKAKIKNVNWNSKKKQFEYTLIKPSRVMMRIGLQEHGPLLVNVLNWVPRANGEQTEHWDGRDESHVLDLVDHPKLEIDIQAYTFSDNTILVGPKPGKVRFAKTNWPKQIRQVKKVKKKRMVAAYQQKPETRGDYLAKLVLPSHLSKTKDGVPIVNGVMAILLTVDETNKNVVLNRRSESVFFIDGQFAFENEVGFLPMTWLLDTSKLNEGEHYLTANIRGYEGNFGIATTKIHVKRQISKR